jgi:hypothetical protein
MVPATPACAAGPEVLPEAAINGLRPSRRDREAPPMTAAALDPSTATPGATAVRWTLSARMWYFRNNGSHLRSPNCKFAFRSAAICLK